MPKPDYISIKELQIDLNNYRIVPQVTEVGAIHALIAIKPKNFYSIMADLIEDGFSETENIIVLKDKESLIVKEGNRRISALKLIHQVYNPLDFDLPQDLQHKIKAVGAEWLKENVKVPCAIYDISEIETVKKIVRRTHGKGEESGRTPWGSVARARLNREENKAPEHGLFLLEAYLKVGKNLTDEERDKWGGDFPLSVLDEFLRKSYSRLGATSVFELVTTYPKITFRSELEKMLHDIGVGYLSFTVMRNTATDFLFRYGIPAPPPPATSDTSSEGDTSSEPAADNESSAGVGGSTTGSHSSSSTPTGSVSNSTSGARVTGGVKNDSKDRKCLIPRSFKVPINNPKVNDIRKEFYTLDVKKHTNATAVMLRVFVELSVDCYIESNGLTKALSSSSSGENLQSKIQITANHLESKKLADVAICKGIRIEIKEKDGLLNIDTLHKYIHSNKFSPKAENLNITWNNISEFMRILWENVN